MSDTRVIGEKREAISFIGAWIPDRDKRQLQTLAKLRRKSVQALLGEMVREAVQPLSELTNSSNQARA